jgi:hypothetical protein
MSTVADTRRSDIMIAEPFGRFWHNPLSLLSNSTEVHPVHEPVTRGAFTSRKKLKINFSNHESAKSDQRYALTQRWGAGFELYLKRPAVPGLRLPSARHALGCADL